MNLKRLSTPVPLRRLVVDADDWQRVEPQDLVWMLQQMILIRRFENRLLELKGDGLINGPVHTSVGQEAVAVGVAMALRREDSILGSHRAHHQYLAKALSALAPAGFDPRRQSLTKAMKDVVRVLLCEVMGLAEGCSGGRGGSMHLINPELGVAGTNAIVAGGVAQAAGVAWADRFLGRDHVTVCFFGDGALYQGVTHEASNLAALWKAPLVYFIENNHYAVATSADAACSAHRLVDAAAAYGMPGLQVDGMDALAVLLAMRSAVQDRGKGGLPCYIEADVYRYYHHAGDVPGSAYGYRDKQEEERWAGRDPIEQFARKLRDLGILDDKQQKRLDRLSERCIEEAVAYCTETASDGRTVVRESLWPTPDSMTHGLRHDGSMADGAFVECERVTCERKIKYSDAIAAVTGRWLEQDPTVVVMGEEVANFGGGAYGATKDLPLKYPDRIRNTPITEAGFCGLACGAAMNGLHPIVELMFSSFALVAADQLFNQIGQLAHIYGGHTSVPLVVRTRVAIGLGYGAQHSMDPAALYALFPGWRILVPTNPFDYIGLFNAAMRARSPSLIVEHQGFYGQEGLIPNDDLDFVVDPGRARVVRRGGQVTVAAYGWTVPQACEAAEELAAEGVDAEVIDLRAVHDAGLDLETLGASIRKTGMLVTAEQSPRCNSLGGKIVRDCQEHYFDFFDGPAVCVNAPDVPLPVSGRLESACIPTTAQLKQAIRKAALREA